MILSAVGDICPGDHYVSLGNGAGSLNREQQFRALASLAPIFRRSDVSMCNLEGVLSGHSIHTDPIESRVFRGNPTWASALADAGITAVNVANNHTMQHGRRAFEDTVQSCKEARLDVVGLADERGLAVPVIKRIAGAELVLLGYSLVADPRAGIHPPYAAPHPDALLKQVRTHVADGGCVVASVHCGDEGATVPDDASLGLAKEVAAAGARIVLVHHSHVYSPPFRFEESIVCPGLGDCFFDLFWHSRFVSACAVEVHFSENAVSHFVCHPFRLRRDYRLESYGPDNSAAIGSICTEKEIEVSPRNFQMGKMRELLRNIHRGRTLLKFRFLSRKVVGWLKP